MCQHEDRFTAFEELAQRYPAVPAMVFAAAAKGVVAARAGDCEAAEAALVVVLAILNDQNLPDEAARGTVRLEQMLREHAPS